VSPPVDVLPDAELRALDDLVERALAGGEEAGLRVLGYGEISLVLGWPPESPRFACKRLPVFRSRGRFEAYRATLERYLEAIESAGVHPVRTEMRAVEVDRGRVAGYVIQPMLPAETLVPAVLSRADPAEGHPLVREVVDAAAAAVSPRLGLDAQLANWAWEGGRLTYFDVSTPLIWSEEGRSLLDMELLAEAYPGILRWPLRRLVAPGILDTYRDLRKVYLDLAGNLIKERLDPWLPAFLEQLNRHLVERPLDAAEVRRYYRSDARLWEVLLRLRRLDRFWRRRVRRRPYPLLLPKRIER
jgi:hypothetical protein